MKKLILTLAGLAGFLVLGSGYAAGQETPGDKRRVVVLLQNDKGKALKNVDGIVSLESQQAPVSIPRDGRLQLEVAEDDILHLIMYNRIFSIEIGDADSLSVIVKNKKLSGYYADNDTDFHTGFGNARVADNQFAVSMIRSSEINNYKTLFEYMVDRVPGVMIKGNSITIRGHSSLNASTEPIVVVDGAIAGSFSEVNSYLSPRDVESITVDKSGFGYGIQGGNGVIIITTKGTEKK